MNDTITIQTDHGPLTLPAQATLETAVVTLLEKSGGSSHSVATAVNGLFVPRHARAEHRLVDGDTVLCFSPITGG